MIDYVLENAEELVKFSVSDDKLAKVKRKNENACTVIANEDNRLGTIKWEATVGEEKITKEIDIISLW